MIFEVELVSKFVQNNILTVGGISRAMFNGVPGQNQGSHSTAGLAKANHNALFPKMLSDLSFLFHHVRQWINKNGEQLGEIIRFAMQQKKACLRRDCQADLIGDAQTAATLEPFFGKKYL